VTQSSAHRKLIHGAEQAKLLLSEAVAYRDSHAYTFDHEKETLDKGWRYRCYATEKEPPPLSWPLVAGDAIQNMRAALDHAVWAAWQSENEGDGRHTQFVIADSPENFGTESRRRLEGVPAYVRDVVERWQPYNRWPQDPSAEMLVALRELSNTDKHRTLSVIATAVDFEGIGVSGLKITDWDHATGKLLGPGRTEVSSFVAQPEGGLEPQHVEPTFQYEVRFERWSVDYLKGIAHDVFRVVTECETGEPPPLFAQYPV
jgi:hypothetical protein